MVLISENWPSGTSTAEPSLEWEEVNCLLCGGSHSQILVEAPDRCPGSKGLRFAVVRCRECGLCYTNPRPSPQSIGQFYPRNYRPHQSQENPGRSRWRRRYPSLPGWLVRKHQALPLHGQGRLLDFGCGGGLFLEQMRQFGWKVTGVDISAGTVRRLRSERGLEAHAGSLPHPDLQPGSFDVITMWHSLEHVHQPRQVLSAAYDLLADDGKLIVATPNIESLPFHWFGPAWFGLDLPRHLVHFGPETLREMLQCCGFAADPVRMVRHSSWLRSSAGLVPDPRKRLWHRLCRARASSRLLSWYHYLTGQSDCIMATAVKN